MERFIEVFPFSHFYWNSQKFLYHLFTLTMVTLARKNAKDLKDGARFPKRLSLQCVSLLIDSVAGRFTTQLQPCR